MNRYIGLMNRYIGLMDRYFDSKVPVVGNSFSKENSTACISESNSL